MLTAEKSLFARSYAKSEPEILYSKISISYFSTVETRTDFPTQSARSGRSQKGAIGHEQSMDTLQATL